MNNIVYFLFSRFIINCIYPKIGRKSHETLCNGIILTLLLIVSHQIKKLSTLQEFVIIHFTLLDIMNIYICIYVYIYIYIYITHYIYITYYTYITYIQNMYIYMYKRQTSKRFPTVVFHIYLSINLSTYDTYDI